MVYCWKCGTSLKEDAAFCYSCGAAVQSSTTGYVKTGLELLRDDKDVQNHWAKRVIAFLVDSVMVSIAVIIVVALVSIPFLLGRVFAPGFPFFPVWWGFFGGVLALSILAYFVIAEALYGKTLGKHVMGLRVERVDGKRLDAWSAFVRNISKVSWILLILDLAVGLGMHGEVSQKWSDRYVGTKVEATARMTIIS